MKHEDFKAWREERHPDEQDAAAIIANATSLPYNEDDARIIENLALDMGGPLPD